MSLFAGVSALAAPNDPLVSEDDFVEWFSLPAPSTAESARIQTALEIASAQIRNGRRLFSPIYAEVVPVDAHGGQVLLLPRDRLPVTSVHIVEQLSGADYVVVDASEYDWSADGYLSRYWSVWPDRPMGCRVTYDVDEAIAPAVGWHSGLPSVDRLAASALLDQLAVGLLE